MDMANPILEGADGVTLTSTGLVVVREQADLVDNVIAKRSSDLLREFHLMMTLNHEATHFIQCFTASAPYRFSFYLHQLSSELMTLSRNNRLTPEVVLQIRSAFLSAVEQYRSPHQNLNTIDLLEAMAVTEAYRCTVVNTQNNSEAFHAFLQSWFPDPESEYRRAIDIVTEMFGKEAGYELTPRLCYIALNGDTPARNFWYFIESLASDRNGSESDLSANEILQLFEMDIGLSLLRSIEVVLPNDCVHPIFKPYMRVLSEVGSLNERYEFAAKPGQLLRDGNSGPVRNLVPPLLVCSGGRGWKMGLASTWSTEEILSYLDASAMIGACLSLLSGRRHSQMCMHEECPVHHSALCHSWFAKPYEISWSKCIFPKRVRVQFGRDVQDVIKLFEQI